MNAYSARPFFDSAGWVLSEQLMTKHLKYGASSSSRWLKCTGSLTIEDEGDESSKYAKEGTAAHELAHQCWILGVHPSEFLGGEIEGFEVTQEMVEAVGLYLNVIHTWATEGSEVRFEEFVEHSQISEHGGTIDVNIVRPDCLVIPDFKYGAGIGVEAENNSQLLTYAACKLSNLEIEPLKIICIVVQPRFVHEDGPVRMWEPTDNDIARHESDVREAIYNEEHDPEFHAGDHCRWCHAKAQCPELLRLNTEAAAESFEVETSELKHRESGLAIAMTPELAVRIRNQRKAVELYFTAVEQWLHNHMEAGGDAPGLKLVQSYGHRKWTEGNEEKLIRNVWRASGVGKKGLYVKKLLTPAKVEKLVAAQCPDGAGRAREIVGRFCFRPTNGTSVVPESDKREAVKRITVAERFEKEEN